jgi:hypothetical protein
MEGWIVLKGFCHAILDAVDETPLPNVKDRGRVPSARWLALSFFLQHYSNGEVVVSVMRKGLVKILIWGSVCLAALAIVAAAVDARYEVIFPSPRIALGPEVAGEDAYPVLVTLRPQLAEKAIATLAERHRGDFS